MFVKKAGFRAKGRRVYFLDGYAGPGVYDSGWKGSPALAFDTAQRLARKRDVRLLLCEKDPALYETLRDVLADGPKNWDAYPGPIEDHLDHLLDQSEACPLFAFFDPFGLPIAFKELTKKVFGRGSRSGAATDVMLNFSLAGLWRVGGKFLPLVDEALGGDWWKEVWRSEDPDRDRLIADGYRQRVSAAAGGWRSWMVPASDTWMGQPAYYLMFFSKHPDGMWAFHEALSHGMEALHKFCHEAEGTPRMFTFEEENREQWTARIKSNIESLLQIKKAFLVGDEINGVFGQWRDVLGVARTRHVRAALNRLYDEDRILNPPTNVKNMNRFWVIRSQ